MDGKKHFLTDADLAIREAENSKGLIRVCGVASRRLVSIPLLGMERLPRKRKGQLRSTHQLGIGGEHAAHGAGAPETALEGGVLDDLSPETVVRRVTDWLEEATEEGGRNFLSKLAFCVDSDSDWLLRKNRSYDGEAA
jgi:hypothetical protein